jgi:hypothetical protein
MERVVGTILFMMVVLVCVGFVLAHFGIVLLLVLAVGFVGHRLRRTGA